MIDPFKIFGVPRRFDIDLVEFAKTHRNLSRASHPDKFARAEASERRLALERAASVNEAWRTLRSPIRRAEALFALAGVKVGEAHEPKASAEFLMEVLDEREALSEARAAKDLAKVRALGAAMERRLAEAEARLASGFAKSFTPEAPEPAAADLVWMLPLLGQVRFYTRFLDEVSLIEEEND